MICVYRLLNEMFFDPLNFGAWSLCAHNDYVNSNNVPFSQVHVFLSPLKLLYLVWNTHLDLSQVRGLCKGPLAPFGNATTDEWSEWLDAGEIVQIDQIFVLTNSLCGQKTSDKLYKIECYATSTPNLGLYLECTLDDSRRRIYDLKRITIDELFFH